MVPPCIVIVNGVYTVPYSTFQLYLYGVGPPYVYITYHTLPYTLIQHQ